MYLIVGIYLQLVSYAVNIVFFFDRLYFVKVKTPEQRRKFIRHFNYVEGIEFPEEYIARGEAWLCYDKFVNIQGGFAFIQKGPFRVVEQLDALHQGKFAEIEKANGPVSELTAVWLHRTYYSRRVRYWTKLVGTALTKPQKMIVYSVDLTKPALRADVFDHIRTGILYEGPVANLAGMAPEKVFVEAVEYATKRDLFLGFVRLLGLQVVSIVQILRVFSNASQGNKNAALNEELLKRELPKGESLNGELQQENSLHEAKAGEFHPAPLNEASVVLDIVKDLSRARRFVFWRDLCVTGLFAWASLLGSMFAEPASWQQVVLVFAAGLFLYKGTMFIHEIAHFRRQLPGFTTAYNIVFGFAVRLPAYTGFPHMYHHSVSRFGTEADPEYEQWSHRSPLNVFRPLVVSFFSPLVLFFRFTVLTVVHLVAGKKIRLLIFTKFSTVVMNLKFERPLKKDSELNEMVVQDFFTLLWQIGFAALFIFDVLPLVGLLTYYLAMVIGTTVGSYRALVNHRYISEFQKVSSVGQVVDSTTILGSVLTPFWAPLNLNYHSLHHMLPAIPYHSLPAAHQRLARRLSARHPYLLSVEPSFQVCIKALYQRATANKKRR